MNTKYLQQKKYENNLKKNCEESVVVGIKVGYICNNA
jgi:hypothetical protein